MKQNTRTHTHTQLNSLARLSFPLTSCMSWKPASLTEKKKNKKQETSFYGSNHLIWNVGHHIHKQKYCVDCAQHKKCPSKRWQPSSMFRSLTAAEWMQSPLCSLALPIVTSQNVGVKKGPSIRSMLPPCYFTRMSFLTREQREGIVGVENREWAVFFCCCCSSLTMSKMLLLDAEQATV